MVILLVAISQFAFAQKAPEIKMDRIRQEKVRELLKDHNIHTTDDLKRIKTSCYDIADSLSYSYQSSTFIIKDSLQEVWQAYKTTSPSQDNDSKNMVSFGLMYSPRNDEISYYQDEFKGMQEGQIIFWNLRILGGIVKIAVGVEVTQINDAQKYFKLCYIADGKTQGTQTIQLFETKEGYTKVVHYTRYKSDSKFRDLHLYPDLHEKAINEFHENVRKHLKEQRKNSHQLY